MQKFPDPFHNLEDFVPSVREAVERQPLDLNQIYMWQAAAVVLGTRPLSQAEFEAIMARLERSCRTFAQGPTSHNCIAALRGTLLRPQN